MAIPIEIFELLEKKIGREETKEVVKVIEDSLETIERKADEVALQKKLEIRDELRKELASKEDVLLVRQELRQELQAVRQELRQEMRTVRQEMQTIKVELEGKIELVKSDIKRLDMKLNFLIILMIIALTLMNPVMAEIIKGWIR